MEHGIHPKLVEDPVRIDLIGVGGNGSQMLTGLARLDHAIRALGHPGLMVRAWDPDQVGSANVGRQLFSPSDIGQNKAALLVHRINSFFGIAWDAAPMAYKTNLNLGVPGIVISCVDSAKARVEISRLIYGRHGIYYWLDLGNRAQDGQVVLGIPPWTDQHRDCHPERLPTVLELFPEIAEGKVKENNTPSCSLAEALERQHLFVNQAVVTPALQILWQLFRFGKISWHGAFVNLATGHVRPLPVDPAAWARIRGGKAQEKK